MCVCMCIYIYMYIYYLSAFNYLICFIISQISTPFAASKAGSFSRFKRLACCAMYEKRPWLGDRVGEDMGESLGMDTTQMIRS